MIIRQKFYLITTVFCLFASLVVSVGQAAPSEQGAVMTEEEIALRTKVKKRAYPGGRDEESLKVQSQLASPLRKMTPTTEMPTESTDTTTNEPHD